MADVTIKSDRFPAGATVTPYYEAQVRQRSRAAQVPLAAAAGSGVTAGADGSCAFTGLDANKVYLAHATVSSEERYCQFTTYS